MPGAGKGLALTPDGQFLVVADGSGAVVINVAAAEADAAGPVVGSLTSPAGSGAVEVLISADGKFAFVTLQNSARMAVFNLGAGLAQGFGPADFVRYVPLAAQPVGMASHDDWLYVVSLAGTLAVVNISKAETKRAACGRSDGASRVRCGPSPDCRRRQDRLGDRPAERHPARVQQRAASDRSEARADRQGHGR